MDILSIFFISISLAIDAFGASLSNGMFLKKISTLTVLKVGCFFGFIQFLITISGYLFGYFFNYYFINNYSHLIGFSLLFILGFSMFYNSFKLSTPKPKNNQYCTNNSKDFLSIKNLFILSIATSIDALVAGISLAVLNTNMLLCSLMIGLASFCLSSLGVVIGYKFKNFFNFNQERFCGIVLIVLSFKVLKL